MTEENNNQWQLVEFNNLKVIGMFNGKVTKKSLNYPSIRTDYIISPLMLLQDYEKGRIKGCTNNNLSFLKTNEDIDTKYYLPGHWQKLGEKNEIIETKEYLSHSDIKTFDSLISGDVVSFEANISYQYAKVKEDIVTKYGIETINYIVIKECFIDNIKNVCKHEENGADIKIKKLINSLN